MNKAKIKQIIDILNNEFENPKPSLDFTNAFECLIAVILSAQCTDKRVNQITPLIFTKHNSPEKIVKLGYNQLSQIIKPCGFFRNKAKNIINLSKILIEKYNSQVPKTLEDLTSLPGVGRKTANVILSQFFHKPALAVDTHVFRISNRLGLAKSKRPDDTEISLCKKIEKKYWTSFHLQLILHGRKTCKALNPQCFNCKLYKLCEWSKKNIYFNNYVKKKSQIK